MTTPSTPPRTADSAVLRGSAVGVAVTLCMTFGVAFGLHALLILGVSQEQADKMAAAILAGMDIAAAVALFGGPAAIGGWILFLIRRAVGQGSKRALVA